LKDFLVQGGPGIIVLGLMVWGAYYLSSQVVTARSNRPVLGNVTGTLTINGKPIPNATIRFRPVEKEAKKAESLGLTDANGRYELFYVRDVPGAAVGEHIVEIEAKDEKGRQRLPQEYHRRSNVHKAVQEGSNEINLDIQIREEEPVAEDAPTNF
jgi:hypothetical protein